MSVRLQLKAIHIALLESYSEYLKDGSVYVPQHIRWTSWSHAYIENERRRRKWQAKKLALHVKFLKRQHYIERVEEGEKVLYKLTAKGQYELLRLNFVLHMQQKQKPHGQLFLAMFDVPEVKRGYRNFFRRLLRENGFKKLQQSVWFTRKDPRPAINELLSYLKLQDYFELIEVECQKCSPKFQKYLRVLDRKNKH